MIVECKKCSYNNDLTELNVNVGHVFDCANCNEPLRAIQQGAKIIGVPIVDIPRPTPPKIPQHGPGSRDSWQEHQKNRSKPKQWLDKELAIRHAELAPGGGIVDVRQVPMAHSKSSEGAERA